MDAEFGALIEGTLSNNAQVARYVEIARQIEQEIQEQDETILHRQVHVSALVNHTGSGTQYSADSQFLGAEKQGAYDSSLYKSGEMTSGDQAAIDAAMAQVASLSDAIVFTYELDHHDVVMFIQAELAKHSPFKTGKYMHGHVVFVDGIQKEDFSSNEIELEIAHEYLFVNTLPYARKIEAGESSMAPNGVYEIVAHEAQDRYGATAIVEFIDYTGVYGVMAEATKATYGHRTKSHLNKAQNRFPAIRLTFPNR